MSLRDELMKMANYLIELNLFNDKIKAYFEYCNKYDYLPNVDELSKEVYKILKKN